MAVIDYDSMLEPYAKRDRRSVYSRKREDWRSLGEKQR